MILVLAFALVVVPVNSEVARIQAHLARVEQELRAADAVGLTAAQRGWRARLLDELHHYWTRGRFPRNALEPHTTPIFVDASGTRCAVAHLIEASGRRDLVARVAAGHNTAYVNELAGDRELVHWLDEHGLTAGEAARIQPTYHRDPFPAGDVCQSDGVCASNRCIQLDDRYGYCSQPCGEGGSCPVGPFEVPMQCDEGDPLPLCRYPSPAPGQIGWPCGTDPDSCLDFCLTGDEVPTCTYQCGNEADCPVGYECRPRDDLGGETVCVAAEDDARCALAGTRATGLAQVILLLAFTGRRAGRGRRRCRRPS